MNDFVEAWKKMKRPDMRGSVFDWMNQTKPIFMEQSKKRENKEQVDDYLRYAKTQKGAILMAVMNGKCSEGIDFSDSEARGVMVFGIPFANYFSKEVQLKRRYLDTRVNRTSVDSLKQFNGEYWYNLIAMRTIN